MSAGSSAGRSVGSCEGRSVHPLGRFLRHFFASVQVTSCYRTTSNLFFSLSHSNGCFLHIISCECTFLRSNFDLIRRTLALSFHRANDTLMPEIQTVPLACFGPVLPNSIRYVSASRRFCAPCLHFSCNSILRRVSSCQEWSRVTCMSYEWLCKEC